MRANGLPAAVTKAVAAWPSGTSGFAFSQCNGAAGSLYCTWVRPAESVVLRVDNTSVPHKVTDFMRGPMDATAIADEFFNAWRVGSYPALRVLGTPSSATAAVAATAQRGRPWIYQDPCSGAAGSLYCTWKDGASSLVLRVSNIEPPARRVIEFRYTP
jgi:hypothetical protein